MGALYHQNFCTFPKIGPQKPLEAPANSPKLEAICHVKSFPETMPISGSQCVHHDATSLHGLDGVKNLAQYDSETLYFNPVINLLLYYCTRKSAQTSMKNISQKCRGM